MENNANNANQPENGIIPVARPERQNWGCFVVPEITAFSLIGVFVQDETRQLLWVLVLFVIIAVPILISYAWKKLTQIRFSEIGVYIGKKLYEWSEFRSVRIAQNGKIRLYIGSRPRGTCSLKYENAQRLLECAEAHGVQVLRD